jgi:hypothetical protein
MALTIITQPTRIQSAFNPIIVEVSTNSTDPIFNYYFEIKDMSGNVISTNRLPKRPVTGRAIIDLSLIVQNKVTFDLSGLINDKVGIYKALNTHFQFNIDIWEESGTTYANVTKKNKVTTSNITIVNSSFPYLETLDTSYLTDYQTDGFFESKFLTSNRGQSVKVRTNQKYELGIIQSLSSLSFDNIEIKTYVNNTLQNTGTIANTFKNTATLENIFLSIQVGVDSINGQTLTTGSQPLIDDSTTHYTITQKSSTTAVSETITFEIDRSCNNQPIDLYWLNKQGRIDSFNFGLRPTERSSAIKSNYQKPIVGFSPTSYEGGETTFNLEYTDTLVVRTNYLYGLESKWLKELVNSSAVWVCMDNKFTSVNVKTNDYEIKDSKFDGMNYLELELLFSHKNYRQRL